jgi:hypothetical protein
VSEAVVSGEDGWVNTFRWEDGGEGWVYPAALPDIPWWALEGDEAEQIPASDVPPERV